MLLNKNKISDSPSSDALVHRTRSSSFFPIPRLFIGLSTKGLTDLDPTRSPTSPLDFKSPKSTKCFDYGKNSAGLGLVNHLTDDDKKVLGSPLRLTSTKSLPKDYGYLCKFDPKMAIKPSKKSELDRLASEEFGKMRSCSADLSKSGLNLNLNFKSGLYLGINNGSGLNDDSLCKSLPISIISSEIEQSEDYTCIISYGPNAKTTHIFGDCILESHVIKSHDGNNANKVKTEIETDFLSFCFACKKKLEGKDIYIYRGEKAFCSCDCRDNEISIEEEREKNSLSDSPPSDFEDSDEIFMAGMVVAT
ncbi:hypothetical protein LUZ60_009629 [Juncus effusus]|nr:hypothetical protein LUZ60_009629 [Juncus effusus]